MPCRLQTSNYQCGIPVLMYDAAANAVSHNDTLCWYEYKWAFFFAGLCLLNTSVRVTRDGHTLTCWDMISMQHVIVARRGGVSEPRRHQVGSSALQCPLGKQQNRDSREMAT